jgi:murein tripeptide amidase MpaA
MTPRSIRFAMVVAALLAAALAAAQPPRKPEFPRSGVTPPAPRPAVPAADSARRVLAMPEPSLTSGDVPAYWRTRAERAGYRQTPDYDETMRYCRQLEAGSRWVKLATYGKSGQGRDLPLLILSKDRAFTPEAARATGKPVLLVQNGIHSGEIEGKDACLALVRDICVTRARQDLLDSVTVLVLPIFSVDAHERRSKYNRINQNGPEEMGWRTTPVGLNLNRDYLKAESPEMQALLRNVYTAWWPELLVDNHTTDGAAYRHDVTFGWPHGAGCPPPIERWMREAFEGRVWKRLEAMGHLPAPYVSFREGNDPLSGIDFGNAPGRFSNGYTLLHGRAAILVETHMLKPYGTRVKATYDAMVALLEELRDRPRELQRAIAESRDGIVARGRATDPGARAFPLATRTTNNSVPFAFKGVVTEWVHSDALGGRVPRYTSAPWDTVIPLFREVVPALEVTQPPGYLVPQEWTVAIDRLQVHGVRFRRFARGWRDTVEMARITDWSASPDVFEGHHLNEVRAVRIERQRRAFRAGDVWVPLDQPSAPIAVTLLEPRSPDGLLAWNQFDTIFQRKEYGEPYVMEPIARDMLAKDPKLAEEFRARVASDSTFARSVWARSDWFFRRSPWADPEQDLHPIARALRAPPADVLEAEAVAPAPGR